MKIENGPYGAIGVINIKDESNLVQYEFESLEQQKLTNLVSCFLRSTKKEPELCYDITGLICLKKADQISWTDQEKKTALLQGLRTILTAEEYYMRPDHFLYAEEDIFINPVKKEFYWCYIPVIQEENQKTVYEEEIEKLLMSSFLLPVLTQTQRTKIIHLLQGHLDNELFEFLLSLEEDDVNEKKNLYIPHALPFFIIILLFLFYLISSFFEFTSTDTVSYLNEYILCAGILFVGITIWKGNKIMQIFNKKREPLPEKISKNILFPTGKSEKKDVSRWPPVFLIELKNDLPVGNHKRAIILTDEFILGKDPFTCDYVLDDKNLEDTHARIERKEDRFFITDLHTEHGTWVRNSRLFAHQKTILENGDMIQLANTNLLFTDGLTNENEELL